MTDIATVPAEKGASRRSILAEMAARYQMSSTLFEQTLTATILPKGASREDLLAFLAVAKQYDLNPFTREIFGFPGKGGGIIVIVSIDGWMKIINSNKKFDGSETSDHRDTEGQLISVTATIWRKDRSHPTVVTEYLSECVRNTEPWQKWPHRMLRHKALIQCARVAFGFAGIAEPDEAERAHDVSPMVEVNLPPKPTIKDKMEAIAKRNGKPVSEDIEPDNSDPAAPSAGAPESVRVREPAAGEGLGSPPEPEPAATIEKRRLRQLHEGLTLAKTDKSLRATWEKFIALFPLSMDTRALAGDIYDAHEQRIKGQSSPTETDERVAELLA